jgi:DNA-binding transcriptional LysR family regulator
MKPSFDPVSLRLFLSVCEEGSVVRAADREAVVASAVSKRVAALEDQLGLSLLQRGPRGMVPTEAGEAFARHAREVLAVMERMQLAMKDIAAGGGGSVRILASLAALSNKLPEDLVRVLERHRSIKVSLREAATTEIVRQVREGTADLGVCWDAADLGGLETLPYRADHACLLVHRGHPLARRKSVRFEETLDYAYISAMPGSMMEIMLRRQAALVGRTMSPRIEVQSFDGVSRTVAAGLGVSVLPREVVSPMADGLGLRMVPLSDPWARRQFVICARTDPHLSASVRLLAEGLRQQPHRTADPAHQAA